MVGRTTSSRTRLAALEERVAERLEPPDPIWGWFAEIRRHEAWEQDARDAIAAGTACAMGDAYRAAREGAKAWAWADYQHRVLAEDSGRPFGSAAHQAFVTAAREALLEHLAAFDAGTATNGRCTTAGPCCQCRHARLLGAPRLRDLWPPGGSTLVEFCPGPRDVVPSPAGNYVGGAA